LGSISCLSGKTCVVFNNIEVQELYRKILFEAVEVAKKDGAIIEDNFIDDSLQRVLNYPISKGSSMLTDRELSKPIEIGAKNGIISLYGKKLSVKTPMNDLICELLIDIEPNSGNLLKKIKL